MGIRSIVVFGGIPKYDQTRILKRGVEVVVATPGRLKDLCNEGVCDLGEVEFLVLDEADRMLDMGFEVDVRYIIGLCREKVRVVLF
jgi:superfamily II DNA/RNA helicase